MCFIAVVTAASGLLFGFDTGVIADAQWQLTQLFSLSSFNWSIIVSAMVFGAFVGALCSGPLTDQLGRKKSLMFTATLFIISTLLLSCSQGFYSLLIGRCLLGLSIGVGSYSAPLFIAEIAPSQLRGRFVLFNSVAITGGEALAFLVGYCLEGSFEGSWRMMFLIGMIPAVFLWIGLLLVPESPRWLMKKNKKNQAYDVLQTLRSGKAEEEWSELVDIARECHKRSYSALLKEPFRKLLLLGIMLGVLQQLSGINIIMYYGPYLFHHAGFQKTGALFSTFLMGMVNLTFTLLAMLYIDKVGRRRLMIHGTGIAGIALMVLSSTFFLHLHRYITFLSVFIFCMSFAVSLGCCFWLLISELYPLHLRVQAMSIATSCQWLANFLVSLIFLPLFESIGPGTTMLFFAIGTLGASIFSYYFLPETKGVSLEKIEKNLIKGNRLRDLGACLSSGANRLEDNLVTQSYTKEQGVL